MSAHRYANHTRFLWVGYVRMGEMPHRATLRVWRTSTAPPQLLVLHESWQEETTPYLPPLLPPLAKG